MNTIELSLFSSRINSICDEMGAVLKRSAFSPNIKDRLDFSCAIFDHQGHLCAQAAHIPVHLGSMAFAMQSIVGSIDWCIGDMVIMNDPFKGGTHLPDITVIAPVFFKDQLLGFVANRAHHADAGCDTPGSMPLSKSLDEEGLIIPPTKIMSSDRIIEEVLNDIIAFSRDPVSERGDYIAQISANLAGLKRLEHLITSLGYSLWREALVELNNYAEKLAYSSLRKIPTGTYHFTDYLDDDGQGRVKIPISIAISCLKSDQELKIEVDFSNTSPQVSGNINCPLSVTAAAVYYVFYCLMPISTPCCTGCFRAIEIKAPEGSLLNAQSPAAVVAGNVETSTRIVDVLLGALSQAIPEKIPAASHGSMNNIAMGANDWAYYETIGGGMGASSLSSGFSTIQTHMTNTLNTPIEVLEMNYPLRIDEYKVRDHSAGEGKNPGGHGIIRAYQFLENTTITLLTERRRISPWGLNGGDSGKMGENLHNKVKIPAKTEIQVEAGEVVTIKTAGGGGWGTESDVMV